MHVCDYGKFQALHMHCSHVIAACSNFYHNYRTLILVVFKIRSVYTIYNIKFKVVHDMSYWPPHEGPKLFHDSAMWRLKKGRPNNTRTTTEMDVAKKTPRKCGLCHKFWRWEKTTRRGGLNCVFGNFFFYVLRFVSFDSPWVW